MNLINSINGPAMGWTGVDMSTTAPFSEVNFLISPNLSKNFRGDIFIDLELLW